MRWERLRAEVEACHPAAEGEAGMPNGGAPWMDLPCALRSRSPPGDRGRGMDAERSRSRDGHSMETDTRDRELGRQKRRLVRAGSPRNGRRRDAWMAPVGTSTPLSCGGLRSVRTVSRVSTGSRLLFLPLRRGGRCRRRMGASSRTNWRSRAEGSRMMRRVTRCGLSCWRFRKSRPISPAGQVHLAPPMALALRAASPCSGSPAELSPASQGKRQHASS